MKVKVLERFIGKGRVIVHPGEVIDVSARQADILVSRGIAKVIGEQEEAPEERAWIRKPCGGCPKRRK